VENTSLKDLLREHLELKGLTAKKVAELTGIPERYIEALLTGNDKLLPPAPYVHGYLTKLAGVLNFDKDTMWRLYQKEAVTIRASGPSDRLPSNRFAVHYLNKNWLLAGLVIILLLGYLTTNIYQLLQPPSLQILSPAGEDLIVIAPLITLSGSADPRATLTINAEEVYVGDDGRFEKEYRLQSGLNTLEFRVKKLGKETVVLKQIIFQSPPPLPISNGQEGTTTR